MPFIWFSGPETKIVSGLISKVLKHQNRYDNRFSNWKSRALFLKLGFQSLNKWCLSKMPLTRVQKPIVFGRVFFDWMLKRNSFSYPFFDKIIRFQLHTMIKKTRVERFKSCSSCNDLNFFFGGCL